MSETWKPIPGYNGLYEASSLGRIRRTFVKTKLSEENLSAAVEMRRAGHTFKSIGECFGVGGPSVFEAIKSIGKTESRRSPNRIRKLYTVFGGYKTVNLSQNGITQVRSVHQLVAECFIGPCPKGLELDHRDGNPSNNRVENLQYITHAQNLFKRRKHSCARKLEGADAIYMRGMAASGYSAEEIAMLFKVTLATVYSVIKNRSHQGI